MKKYKLICKKGEGTFSEVVKAENIEDGKEYAIKCMKSTYDDIQQVRFRCNFKTVSYSFQFVRVSNFLEFYRVRFIA